MFFFIDYQTEKYSSGQTRIRIDEDSQEHRNERDRKYQEDQESPLETRKVSGQAEQTFRTQNSYWQEKVEHEPVLKGKPSIVEMIEQEIEYS